MSTTARRNAGQAKATREKPPAATARSAGTRDRRSPGGADDYPTDAVTTAADRTRRQPAKAAASGRKTRSMSDEHKSAIQSGRAQTKVVREYLEVLENRRPRRGPRPDPAKMRGRIDAIAVELATAAPLERVTLHQERMDLGRQLETLEQGDRYEELEENFVSVVDEYSRRRGITAEAWLAVGVPKGVLKRGGVS